MEDISTAAEEIKREVHVSIELVTSIKVMFNSLSAKSSECCIYKVPERLRKVNSEAYTPRAVSIGPFHRGEKHLDAMEEHKMRYLQTFLIRTSRSLEDCLEIVRTWEENTRHCYAETIKLSSDEFVKMILVDGSFIVELLLRFCFPELIDKSDRIFHKPWMRRDVRYDMLLLENQLPFFVLEGFFNLIPTIPFLKGNLSFTKLVDKCFKYFVNIVELPDATSSSRTKHFVDFIRDCYLSSFPKVQGVGDAEYDGSPSATELHEAGIKFEVGTSFSLFDIKFANGILEIPPLVISDKTEILFRNLIAFEQCHYEHGYMIFDYLSILDGLIDTSADVDLLVHHGIIRNKLGSNEDVSELFNDIGKGVITTHQICYSGLCENLHTYCKTSWHKWQATLKRDYFNTPWAIVSFFAAALLLVLTFIQTVLSIKSS